MNILEHEEICPGLTYAQHAESVAMFNLKDYRYSMSELATETHSVLLAIQPQQEL